MELREVLTSWAALGLELSEVSTPNLCRNPNVPGVAHLVSCSMVRNTSENPWGLRAVVRHCGELLELAWCEECLGRNPVGRVLAAGGVERVRRAGSGSQTLGGLLRLEFEREKLRKAHRELERGEGEPALVAVVVGQRANSWREAGVLGDALCRELKELEERLRLPKTGGQRVLVVLDLIAVMLESSEELARVAMGARPVVGVLDGRLRLAVLEPKTLDGLESALPIKEWVELSESDDEVVLETALALWRDGGEYSDLQAALRAGREL